MKNKHIVRIIIFYVLMFASSFGGTIEELLRHDYDYNYAIFKIREICEKQAEQLKIEFIDKTLNW